MRKLGQYCAKWLTGYGYHCFYAFLWLAGLFTVTALVAVFWLGPEKYIVPAPGAGWRPSLRPARPGQPARLRPPAGVRAGQRPGRIGRPGRVGEPVGAGQPAGFGQPVGGAPSASAPAATPSASPIARAPAAAGRAVTAPPPGRAPIRPGSVTRSGSPFPSST